MGKEKTVTIMKNGVSFQTILNDPKIEFLAIIRSIVDIFRDNGYGVEIYCKDKTFTKIINQSSHFTVGINIKIAKNCHKYVDVINENILSFVNQNKDVFWYSAFSFNGGKKAYLEFISKDNTFNINDVMTIFDMKNIVTVSPSLELEIPKNKK